MNRAPLCESCGRKAEYVVVLRSGDALTTERHLCNACASDFERISAGRVGPTLCDLFRGLAMDDSIASPETNRTKVCHNCGNTEREVLETGSVGCPACYDLFQPQIQAIVEEMHGWTPRE